MRSLSCLLLAGALAAAAPAAVEVGPAFRGVAPDVLGMDGAFSLPLGSGQSLWIFGDTLMGHWTPDGHRVITGMPSCTGAIVSDGDWPTGFAHARSVAGAAPLLVAPGRPDARLWPLDAIRVDGRDWLYYVEIAATGKGPMDFKIVGTGVARGEGTPPHRFTVAAQRWDGRMPSYGASAFAHDGWIYLYAGGGKATYLARTRPGDLVAGAITYWKAPAGWVSDWRQASALPPSGPELSVRWNAYLGRFLMVYVPPFDTQVVARRAATPWGPWSAPARLVACQGAGLPGVFFYGGKQHAELASENGRQIVVSYNTNGPQALVETHPELYWPHLARVTLSR